MTCLSHQLSCLAIKNVKCLVSLSEENTIVAKEEHPLVPLGPWRSMVCTVLKNKPTAILEEPQAHVRPEPGAL